MNLQVLRLLFRFFFSQPFAVEAPAKITAFGGILLAQEMPMRFVLAIIVLIGLSITQGDAQQVLEAEFPFELREGLIWIQVNVPQSAESLHFLLDSGAEVSVIDLGVARRLRLKLGHPVGVSGVNSTVPGYWPQYLSAHLGSVLLPKSYLAVDLRELSKACDCEVDGLLGANFFREHLVQIDFQARKIRLLKSINPDACSESVPLEPRRSGIRILLQVNGGKQQWLRLDTGCASALQWVPPRMPAEPFLYKTAVGMTEVLVPLVETTVRIGTVEFAHVATGIEDHRIFVGEDGLLGTGLLSRFAAITIDTSAHRLILRAAHALD